MACYLPGRRPARHGDCRHGSAKTSLEDKRVTRLHGVTRRNLTSNTGPTRIGRLRLFRIQAEGGLDCRAEVDGMVLDEANGRCFLAERDGQL